jgi:hypothetical protein
MVNKFVMCLKKNDRSCSSAHVNSGACATTASFDSGHMNIEVRTLGERTISQTSRVKIRLQSQMNNFSYQTHTNTIVVLEKAEASTASSGSKSMHACPPLRWRSFLAH